MPRKPAVQGFGSAATDWPRLPGFPVTIPFRQRIPPSIGMRGLPPSRNASTLGGGWLAQARIASRSMNRLTGSPCALRRGHG